MNIEPWIVFVLLGTIARGFYSFITKIVTVKKLNYDYVIVLYAIIGLICSVFFFDFKNLNIDILFFGSLFAILMLLTLKTSFKTLENISPSIFFISFRTFSTILLILIGMFFFNEFLTLKQFLGILLGFLTFFLLYDIRDVPDKKSNFTLGIFLLGLYIVLIAISNSINKYVSLKYAISDYLFYLFLSLSLFAIINLFISSFKKDFDIDFKDIGYYIYSPALGLLFYLTWVFILKAYSMQSLAVVYKIFSFEIIIPIVLSIILYKERITKRKLLAFVLTVVSIFLLV